MNSLRNNLLLRVYLFGGLVLFVGLSILFAILREAPQDYVHASKWVFSGVIASVIPIILAVSYVGELTKGMLGSKLIKNNFLRILCNGVMLAILIIVMASLVIDLLFGSKALEEYILENTSVGIIVFPVSILLCALYTKADSK